jgi:hypothetical protein
MIFDVPNLRVRGTEPIAVLSVSASSSFRFSQCENRVHPMQASSHGLPGNGILLGELGKSSA